MRLFFLPASGLCHTVALGNHVARRAVRKKPAVRLEQCGGVNKPRRLPASSYRAAIEQRDLIAPAVPSLISFTREQLEIRPRHEPLDALAYAIGLAAVFARQ